MPMTQEQLLEVQRRCRVFQERADQVFEPWGFQAPAPVLGEDHGDYRRRLAILAKKQLPDDHKLRQVQVRRMDDQALNMMEPQIYQACRTEAFNPNTVPPGQFRRIPYTGPDGYKEIRFVGPRSFVHEFSRPGRRVASFNTPNGPIDASGRYLR
jgi:hypothetical protein